MMNRVIAGLGSSGNGGELDVADPVLPAVRTLLHTPSGAPERAATFMVGGKPYLAEMATTGAADLLKHNTVVIAAPLDDFTGATVELLREALEIAGTLLAIGILLSLLVARLVSRSLSSLTVDARQIGNLELGAEGKVHSRVAEINTLAGALGSARQAISTFALYMPRELVRKIVASEQAAAGSAVRQEVTVLFTDIRDFTSISESRSPEEVVALLSAYFELMNGIVERHDGVIVQYSGTPSTRCGMRPSPTQTMLTMPAAARWHCRPASTDSTVITAPRDCRNWSPASGCIPARRWSAASGHAPVASIRQWAIR